MILSDQSHPPPCCLGGVPAGPSDTEENWIQQIIAGFSMVEDDHFHRVLLDLAPIESPTSQLQHQYHYHGRDDNYGRTVVSFIDDGEEKDWEIPEKLLLCLCSGAWVVGARTHWVGKGSCGTAIGSLLKSGKSLETNAKKSKNYAKHRDESALRDAHTHNDAD